MKIQLTAVIITFNEEKNIEKCLASLQGVADEIVVVDSFSTDKTKEICSKYKVNFHQQKWLGYSEQKNLGNQLAANKLIFSIDADEVLSDELKVSINKVKETAARGVVYKLNRRNNYCGKWIKHCGWYPDAKVRLWFKDDAKWEGDIHEEVVYSNEFEAQQLKGDLLHYSFYTIHQHIAQVNTFTEIAAREALAKGKKSNVITIIGKSFWKFIHSYFIKLGILDGYYGFVICSISSFSTFSKYAKTKQFHKAK
mgnify:CR=1 FL=1|tara:strand:+ start:137 stop:895 length:759 start_codon:yes stop_codon:yes gene_type:complete